MQRRFNQAPSPSERNVAELLARLSNVSTAIVYLSRDHADPVTTGLDVAIDSARLQKEASEATKSERCVAVSASAPGFWAAAQLARHRRSNGVVFARLSENQEGGSLACVVAPKDEPLDKVRQRVACASILAGAWWSTSDDPNSQALRRQMRRVYVTLERNGVVRAADPGIEAMTGCAAEDLRDAPLAEILVHRSRPRFQRHLEQIATQSPVSAVYGVLRPDGSRIPVLATLTLVRMDGDEAVFAHLRELTSLKAAREVVGRIALTILPETGTTIRADRLLSETAEALDLRLVAIAVSDPLAGHDAAPARIESAAGSAVHHLDRLLKLTAPRPWDSAFAETRVVVDSQFADSDHPHAVELAAMDLRGFAAMPLVAPDKTGLGVLLAFSELTDAFTAYEIESLKIIAEFVATDLDRQRAERALERRAAELAALLEATRDLTALREPEGLLQDVVQRAVDLIPAAQTGSLLFEENGFLIPKYRRGGTSDADLRAMRIPIESSRIGRVFRDRAGTLLADDDTIDAELALAPEVRDSVRRDLKQLGRLRGVLAVPLVAGGVSLGVLALSQFGECDRFKPRDLELLERYAGLAAAAIVQVRLFEAVRLRSALVEAVREAVISIKADGSIGLSNEGTHALFGRQVSAQGRTTFAQFFETSESAALTAAMDAVRRTGHWVGFLKALSSEGTAFDAAVALSRIPGSDEIVAIVSDVTERRQLEARALQSKTLDSLGKLAAGLAHDFNNHLASIVGLATLVRTKLPADSPLLDHILDIEQVADQAAQLAKRLLVLGRTAPGTRSQIEMNSIVTSLADVLRHTFDPSIEIDVQIAPGRCLFMGDETAIRQALLNLATNARDAMPRGGRLRVATAMREAGADGPARVEITVADTGMGMPPEVLRRLYEPFFTTKPLGKGTGLGCAIVFATVRAHGGTIDCDSKPGEGTTFRITFPATELAAPGVAAPAPSDLERGSGQILVVEDEAMLRRVTTDMLVSLGYDVIPVAGGREALEVIRAQGSAIDVVLLDMTMPGMSGPEVFEAIKAHDPGKRIVITTGYAAGNAAEALLARGALSLLLKPYRVQELSQVIAAAVRAPRRAAERQMY